MNGVFPTHGVNAHVQFPNTCAESVAAWPAAPQASGERATALPPARLSHTSSPPSRQRMHGCHATVAPLALLTCHKRCGRPHRPPCAQVTLMT